MGILPEFINGLPYETRVIHMSMQDWSGAPGRQEQFLDYVRSKLDQYEEYYKDSSRWIKLNEGDREGDHVTFLEIDRLP
jgi:serine/threonine-protein kinase PpkA